MIERPTKQLLADGDSNTKLRKNEGQGYITAGLSLSPSTEAGIGNTCPHASEGCKAACLDHQGMASVFKKIRESRMNKTRHYYNQREDFYAWLRSEVKRYIRKATRKDSKLAVRLNVFSDIPWEASGVIDEFPDVQFYDYTKNPRRAGQLRPNYWVTFSRSESNEAECLEVLRNGQNGNSAKKPPAAGRLIRYNYQTDVRPQPQRKVPDMFEIHPLFVFAGIMVCIYLLSLLQSSADIASLREQLSAERASHNKTYARMIRAEQLLGNPEKFQK